MGKIVPDREGYLDVGDHRIRWEYVGRGDREAVCLLNGLAMHTRAWYGVLPRLLDRYDVVLYDYLGQGKSSAPDEPHSIPAFAGYLPMVLDALGIERVHAVGVSYGGFVAAEVARLFPGRLHTLTLAQDPFFESLDGNLAGYAAFPGPVLVVPGAEDRTIPPRVQRKLLSVFRDARWEPIEGSGHVVYLEKPDAFFGVLRRFLEAKSTSF